MSRLKSVVQFFVSELQIPALRIFEIQKNFWDNVSCGDPFLLKQTLVNLLCRIPALNSFVENFQGGLQVFFKSTTLQMFSKVSEKFPKIIGATYENSNIYYKIFYADGKTSKWLFRSCTLMKSCYSKRYIKIHGPQPTRSSYFFT